MCETGYADGCRKPDTYLTETNRVANPGLTVVTLGACIDHLAEAVSDQLSNNTRLGAQGMRGETRSYRDNGITVTVQRPDLAESSDQSDSEDQS
jgi:hypothetical protein